MTDARHIAVWPDMRSTTIDRTRFGAIAVPVLLIAACLVTVSARATTRGGFFDTSRRPTIQFDRKTLTWTLRNQAIERVVHFDAKAGALRTVSLRDLKHGWNAPIDPAFEGRFAFAAPVIGMPTPLSPWKTTTAAPPTNWAAPEFDDSGWSTYEPGGDARVRWYRARIPAGLMIEPHAWALLFNRALHGEAEIYLDGVLKQKIAAPDHPLERLLEIDIPAAARLVAIKMTDPAAPADFTGSVCVAQIGSAPPDAELNQDWKYVVHAVNMGEGGSMTLSISLSGLKRYEGMDVDVYYQIYGGDEPFLVKWFTFVSHRSTRYTLEEVTYDRFSLPGAPRTFAGSVTASGDPKGGSGFVAGVLSLAGRTEPSDDGKMISVVDRPEFAIRPNTPQDSARAVTGLYRGSASAGAFLYQLYIGQYVAHATPISVPNAYNTWFGYREGISAATCQAIIPTAADLGVKLFVLDHGWETNASPDTGTLGDWLTDRSPLKFPQGLIPISLMAREHGMRFGLWTAPTAVNEKSQAAQVHGSWLLKQPGNEPVSAFDNTVRMCFTSGWADNWTGSIHDLCREIGATYLRVDGTLFYDFCCDPAHDHAVGRALPNQSEYWGRIADEMRKIDPGFLLSRSSEYRPEMTAIQDCLFAEWELEPDPKRSADPEWWYRSADSVRRSLHDIAWTVPGFALEGDAPCHIPAAAPDLAALEYDLTSAAACAGSMVIQGKLDEMKPEEQALVKRWLTWNEENRPWLAYTQPLDSLGTPWDPAARDQKPHADGVLHLRNALQGRYGYVCLWNPAASPETVPISFRPADYFVRVAPDLEAVRLKDNTPVRASQQNGDVTLGPITLAPHSWEIYEIRRARSR